MTSLTHAIRIFQRGGLSHEEFLVQIDRALATDRANPKQLMEILTEEHTKVPLPPDVYAEVQRRIEHRVEPAVGAGEETRMQTERIQTAQRAPAVPPQASDAERMKGVGDTLNGRFVLEECLGFGGMGTVYKALDLRKLEASDRNPYIAIKVLNVQFRGHPKSLIALQREAKKAQTLAHPNIVTVYDFDRDGAMVYLTMEYLSGQPLNRVLRAPGFAGMPYAKAMRIVDGMGKALAYAHQRGFVHCDFKPANVFLMANGEVKVIDFGIARVFQKSEEDAEATVFDPGSLGGLTPAYASPEMLEHREPDPRDDIYALGCITYELLTGRHPFDRQSATQARAAGVKPQRPEHLNARQWRALRAALCFDRAGRTPSVARFLDEMEGRRRPAATGLAVSGIAAAGLLAFGLSFYWSTRDDGAGGSAGSLPTPGAAPEAAVPVEAPPADAAAPSATVALAVPEPPLSLDAVAPILAGVPCSALAAAINGQELRVEGYLSAGYGVPRLKDALAGVPGVKRVDAAVEAVSEDKCSVVEFFAPYWARNRQGSGATIRTRGARAQFTEGDQLVVDIKAPGFDSFVNIDYYVLDGNVVHLVPSPRAREQQAPANYAATVGSLGNWVIAKPFGTELIVLLATPAPLFDGLRPEAEPRADYLGAVKKELARVAEKHGADRIAVDFVQITTKPKQR